VRWYLRYALSLRDVEELLAERGMGHCCTKAKGVLARHSALVRFFDNNVRAESFNAALKVERVNRTLVLQP